VGRTAQWDFIGFLPHRLDTVLEEGGFEPAPIKRLWNDRGWLRTSPQRGTYYRTRMAGSTTDFIAIQRTAIEEVYGPGEEERTADLVRFPLPAVRAAGA
jgi:hypothetical protein